MNTKKMLFLGLCTGLFFNGLMSTPKEKFFNSVDGYIKIYKVKGAKLKEAKAIAENIKNLSNVVIEQLQRYKNISDSESREQLMKDIQMHDQFIEGLIRELLMEKLSSNMTSVTKLKGYYTKMKDNIIMMKK